MISTLLKRRGTTLAGIFGLAFSCVLLLCGAGSVPVENFLPQGAMQGDLNAGGHNLTNAATVYATTVSAANVVVSGSLTAPSSFTLPFSQLTSAPTTLSGYGIADPIVLTSGSYANPAWITALPWSVIDTTPTTLAGYGITDPIVLTSGSYADPAWITALPWSVIDTTPISAAGYGIVNGANLDTLAAASGTTGYIWTITGSGTAAYQAPPGVTWPLVSTDGNLSFGSTAGTLGYVDDSGNAVFASLTSPIVGGTGSTPVSGNVGYEANSRVTSAGSVSLTTSTPTTVTSITGVPAGHYLVSGSVIFNANAATVTQLRAYCTPSLASDLVYLSPQFVAATGNNTCTLATLPWNPTGSSNTLNLTAQATFSAGTVSAYGSIYLWEAP